MVAIVLRRNLYWITRIPSQTCHAKPKTQINRRRTLQLLPVGGMPTASSLAWKTSPKSQDAVALQQIGRWRFTMIDRGDIRQAIDRCSNIWASTAGFGYGQFRHQAAAWLQNSKKRAERSERLMYEQVTAIISALVITIIVCLSWAVNHYRDNAITYKAQRDKPNFWSWRTRQLLTWCVSVMLLRSMQIHEGVSWC